MITHTFLLRATIAIVLLTHGIPSIITGDVNLFGNLFLNQNGFAPLGVPLAWLIKLSHIVCAILLILNKYIKPSCMVAIFILVMGIALVHLKDGWFVVGGGRNGIEYNVVLISVLVFIMYPEGFTRNRAS
ncbi:MAG: DoxX family protein [Cyclobacteriaceae bacterium]|jgi:putative oxidoreductase